MYLMMCMSLIYLGLALLSIFTPARASGIAMAMLRGAQDTGVGAEDHHV